MTSRSAASFCFSANIVFKVFSWDSSFSMEISDLPSGAAESLVVTHELSSPTLPSNLFQHSTRVVILATHSLVVSWTETQRSLKAATCLSASSWVVIFEAEQAASSKIFNFASHSSWKFFESPRISQDSTRDLGWFKPSMILCSAFFIQGSKALMPVWNSAKYLTSSLNLAHSLLISSSSLLSSLRTVLSLSMNFLASEETFSPCLGNISSFSASCLEQNSDFL